MVAGAPDSTQQHPQASSASVPSAEEEALKRNTDCVYFLASPLTCKKGSECEYRHSEYARVNPRDCWYWLNGNCLNPKCAFRHPPLDGLLGAQASASIGASLPPQQVAVPPSTPNSYNNSGRQAVPCIFFQKGLCLKGDKCSFLHGANSFGNKVQQATPTMLTGDLSTSRKPPGVLQKCFQEQQVPAQSSKPPVLQSSAKLVLNAEYDTPGNVGSLEKSSVARSTDEEASQCKPSHPSSILNGSLQSRSGRSHHTYAFDERSFQNDKEADEFLRESSPGFDVLVDDELGDPEYYHGEDQFRRTRTRERRISSSANEYEMDHPADFNSLSDADREMLHDRHIFESYDQMSGQFGWDQPRNQSEKIFGGLSHREGRNHVNSETPEFFGGSDLRHRLSKQRRVNGLRSVVSNDFVPDSHVEERNYRGSSQRDSQHASSQESSLSDRLRGRVKFPGRSVGDGHEDKPDWQMDRERSLGRLHQGRLRDRLKGRLQEENSSAVGKRSSSPQMRRETWDGTDANFAGPKSLSELKSMGQQIKGQESSSLAVRRQDERAGDQQSDVDLSFEGPKPLSVLLKRKREAKTTAASKCGPSVGTEGSCGWVNGSGLIESRTSPANAQIQSSLSQSKEDGLNCQANKEEGIKLTSIDAVGNMQQGILGTHGGQSSLQGNVNPSKEREESMVVQDAIHEHELEGDDQQDGEYDYEHVDEGEYNYDGENGDEEYLDDEDGDDFAKKVGVMLT
ncbi:zinc finger CCCH domain-containing protein 17 [Punica granatum]|uniref:Zinc finger CCCH domain-containing protein 17 n=1 Tax=Punica granatum TaxID=22663 RepID=A0A6P8DZF8_PUNGR|nr:zinc finger CCCH domain-containing protein 17 [Punica granatum]